MKTQTQKIAFYADQESSWPSVYKTDLSCREKVAIAKKAYPVSWLETSPLTPNSYAYDIVGIIPRWWYIAISNCADEAQQVGDQGLAIAYWSIHFTNKGGLWTYVETGGC